MARPIARTEGVCFAFPDVLVTPTSGGPVPMPYPNVAQLAEAAPAARDVNAGGKPVVLEGDEIRSSTGGEPSGQPLTRCTFTSASTTVKANGQGVVRQGDTTSQNGGGSTGSVMVGLPTVLVGG